MKQTEKFRFTHADAERRLLRRLLVICLVMIVATQVAANARSQEGEEPPAKQSTAPGDTMKSRVLQIPAGSLVEVQLTSREELQGQLGDLRDDGFVLRTAANNRLTDRYVQFEELRSLRPLSGEQSRGAAFDRALGWSRLVMGLVVGGLAVGLLACAVAQAR